MKREAPKWLLSNKRDLRLSPCLNMKEVEDKRKKDNIYRLPKTKAAIFFLTIPSGIRKSTHSNANISAITAAITKRLAIETIVGSVQSARFIYRQ